MMNYYVINRKFDSLTWASIVWLAIIDFTVLSNFFPFLFSLWFMAIFPICALQMTLF